LFFYTGCMVLRAVTCVVLRRQFGTKRRRR
jgi:hypothetical protein